MEEQQIEIADQLLKDLGLENLKDPVKSQLIETIRDRVAQKTMLVLMENLPESEIPALEQAIENKNENEIIQEMVKRIPDLNEKLTSALADLYKELLEDTKKLINDNTDKKDPDYV